MGWKPLHLLVSTSAGQSILTAAGLDAAGRHRLAALHQRDIAAPKWANDPAVVVEFQAFREKYLPNVTADTDRLHLVVGGAHAATHPNAATNSRTTMC